MAKKLFATILAAAALFVFAGCNSAQAKTFAKNGTSITANTDFTEKTKSGHELYLESDYASISVKREKFDDLEGLTKDSSLRDYSNSVVKNNALSDIEVKNFGGTDGYDYFEYQKKNGGTNYSYLAATAKGKDSFYLITFQARPDDYKNYQSVFREWAKSVRVDNAAD